MAPQQLAATVRRIERAGGGLATASVARMDEVLPWFRELPADQRAWVMLVAQAGVRSLVEWLDNAGSSQEGSDDIFDTAPRALARSLNLQQTVQLIKVTIDVVEEQVPHLAAAGEEAALREAVLKFSREVAFAAARVYARAAESRGSWDARLQASLVDALLRGDIPDVVASRAAALGWGDAPPVAVAAGRLLRQDVYGSVSRAGGELLETLDAFFAAGGVLESAARNLFVHPNTVRYRLRRVSELTGLAPFSGRDAFALRVALAIGRLDPGATAPQL